MTDRRVLALSRDVGSVQAILPVLLHLNSDPAYELTVISLEATKSLFERYGISYQPFDEIAFEFDAVKYVKHLLCLHNPALVLSGSSPAKLISPETPEQFITWVAKRYAIKTLAVQDFWGMYKERFFNIKGKLDIRLIPDRLCVLDSQSKMQLIKLGIDQKHLIITHNPSMDQVVSGLNDLPAVSNLLRDNNLNVLFVSQPLHETNAFHGRPYDQEDILRGIVAVMLPVQSSEINHKIIIWSHPAEDSDRWSDMDEWRHPGLDVSVSKKRGATILAHVDLVVTSHSTVIYEALYYGTPCVSFRPGGDVIEPLVTDYLGLSKSFTNEADFKLYMQNNNFRKERILLRQQKKKLMKQNIFFSDGKATSRVLKEITNLLDS